MKVTSHTSISFPKIGFAISAGDTVDLPTTLTKEEVEQILAEPNIVVVDGNAKKDTVKPELGDAA